MIDIIEKNREQLIELCEDLDLVSRPAIRDPEFRETVTRTAVTIYER